MGDYDERRDGAPPCTECRSDGAHKLSCSEREDGQARVTLEATPYCSGDKNIDASIPALPKAGTANLRNDSERFEGSEADYAAALASAGFHVQKNLAHPFLGPTDEDRWTVWCDECGRDSGYHWRPCSKLGVTMEERLHPAPAAVPCSADAQPPYREDMRRIGEALGLHENVSDIGHILGAIDELRTAEAQPDAIGLLTGEIERLTQALADARRGRPDVRPLTEAQIVGACANYLGAGLGNIANGAPKPADWLMYVSNECEALLGGAWRQHIDDPAEAARCVAEHEHGKPGGESPKPRVSEVTGKCATCHDTGKNLNDGKPCPAEGCQAAPSSGSARTISVPVDYFDATEAVIDAAKAVAGGRIPAVSSELLGSDWKHSRIADSLTDKLIAAIGALPEAQFTSHAPKEKP